MAKDGTLRHPVALCLASLSMFPRLSSEEHWGRSCQRGLSSLMGGSLLLERELYHLCCFLVCLAQLLLIFSPSLFCHLYHSIAVAGRDWSYWYDLGQSSTAILRSALCAQSLASQTGAKWLRLNHGIQTPGNTIKAENDQLGLEGFKG